MRFESTRGESPKVLAPEALLSGAAPDGGLYLPDSFPSLSHLLDADLDYAGLASAVFSALLPGFPGEELRLAAESAYPGAFDTPQVAPLVPLGEDYLLELFHGPTAAFKDLALQVLPRLMALARERVAPGTRAVVLAATSGDTGSAAMRGFRNLPGFRVLAYYPGRGISAVQEAQMTTMAGDNLEAVAVDGNFDDAQAGVKAAFARARGCLPPGVLLSSANSINIGRLVPQIVYYVHALRALRRMGALPPGAEADFAVPTGNFGDILAGYLAKAMGLPVGRLLCASNRNRVLADFLETGVYDRRRELLPSLSPSMDILVSGNLERLLYLASGRDAVRVRGWMEGLNKEGAYRVPPEVLEEIQRDFEGGSADDAQTRAAIARAWEAHHALLDPHTAAGYAVMRRAARRPGRPRVLLATASPFKFPRVVLCALGRPDPGDGAWPEALCEAAGLPVPPSLAGLSSRPRLHRERVTRDAVASDALARALA